MDHVAILRKANISKKDNLLRDILTGAKTIESRWYVHKIDPWNKVSAGDTVYLKESGCPVTAAAHVAQVVQYPHLTKALISEIIKTYGKQIAPGTSEEEFLDWGEKNLNKNYCILIFLKDIRRVEPFNINKKGFGISSAWLCVGNISKVRI
jgi:hypothetical protein